jgi:hypothetical protein
MTQYLVGVGTDLVTGSLNIISPQPRTKGLEYKRWVEAMDGTRYATGPYIEFEWDLLQGATEYQALLTSFGINVSTSANVSIYARDSTYTWRYYNGKAMQPRVGHEVTWIRYFPRRITILVKNLEVYTPAS